MADTWSFSDNVIFLWPKLPWASLVAQMVKSLPAMRETQVQSLGQKDPLEKEMATNSSILAWKIPWMEKPGGLQSMGLQRVRHDWVTDTNHLRISLETNSEITVTSPQLFLIIINCSFSNTSVSFCPTLFARTHSQADLGLGSGRAFLITLPPPPALPSLLSWRSAAAASATGKARNRPRSGWGRHIHFYFEASCEKKKIVLPIIGMKP